jgi:hypothetical protein
MDALFGAAPRKILFLKDCINYRKELPGLLRMPILKPIRSPFFSN